jgi:hypothetical protein
VEELKLEGVKVWNVLDLGTLLIHNHGSQDLRPAVRHFAIAPARGE